MYRWLTVFVVLFAFWLRVDDLQTLPPGLSNDEGVNAVDAFHFAQTGTFPLYEDPNRPEPLFRFVQAAGAFFFGASVWAFRFTSVLVTTLSIAAAYRAGVETFYDLSPQQRRLAGVAAAAVLAVSISYMTLSRTLYRAIPQPLFMLLFVAFLLRGLRANRYRDIALVMLFLALAMYTYTAALALPLSLAAVAVSYILFQREVWRSWLAKLAFGGVVLFILTLPIGYLLLANPEVVIGRAAEVAGGGGSIFSVNRLQGFVDHFLFRGDENPQYNVESVPLLQPGFNVLFLLGAVVMFIRFRRVSTALVAALFILSAAPELATSEVPHGLRVMGQFAVFPLIVGAGVVAVVYGLRRLLPDRLTYRSAAVVLLLLTIGVGVYGRGVYVFSWDNPETRWRMFSQDMTSADWFFRADRKEFGLWLNAQDAPLLVPADELNRRTTRVWIMDGYPIVQGAADNVLIPADTQVVVPWALELDGLMLDSRQYALLTNGTATILPPFDESTHAAIIEQVDSGETVERANGDLLARVVSLPETVTYAPQYDVVVNFADEVGLYGWRGPDTLPTTPDDLATFTLDLATAGNLQHEYSTFLQLQTQDQNSLAGSDVRVWRWLFPSTVWRFTDSISDTHILDLPETLEPGVYRLVAGMYTSIFVDERLDAFGADGTPLGDAVTLAWVKVPQTDEPTVPSNTATVDAQIDEFFALRGATVAEADANALDITLYWEGIADRPQIDATIFIHLVDESGEIVAQQDVRPQNGQYPTFIWDAGEIVATQHTLTTEADPDTLRLLVGMYTFPDLTRLTTTQDGEPIIDGRIDVGEIGTLLDE